MQWPKEKGKEGKQHKQNRNKTKDGATQIPLKTVGELG
jgi:hypothetical protein